MSQLDERIGAPQGEDGGHEYRGRGGRSAVLGRAASRGVEVVEDASDDSAVCDERSNLQGSRPGSEDR